MARNVSTKTAAAPTQEELAEQIATLRTDLAAITETLGQMARAQGDQLSASARKRVAETRLRGEEHLAEINAQATKLGAEARGQIQEKPMLILGLAAGLGFLIGLSSSRR